MPNIMQEIASFICRCHNAIVFRFGKGRLHHALFGHGAKVCPCCGQQVRLFLPHGNPLRLSAVCPFCGAHERHRQDVLALRHARLIPPAARIKLMEVAPYPSTEKWFRSLDKVEYLSADLTMPEAMECFDLCEIPYSGDTFDAIYCSHVLEHIPDDIKAISEVYRVLKPGGWAILNVPIHGLRTVEDSSVTDASERRRLFGHEGHVRLCGEDYIQRFTNAGFVVTSWRASEFLTALERRRYGLAKAGRMSNLCRKPDAAETQSGFQ